MGCTRGHAGPPVRFPVFPNAWLIFDFSLPTLPPTAIPCPPRLRRSESTLLQSLESLDEQYPRNLVIVAQNGGLHEHTKRQVCCCLRALCCARRIWLTSSSAFLKRLQCFLESSLRVVRCAIIFKRQLDRAYRWYLCQIPGKLGASFVPVCGLTSQHPIDISNSLQR